jgi:D-inositol-3-phosphate glycosyltransferase
LLVEGHQPSSYADVLTNLLSDVEKHRRLSTGAIAHAAKFSWDRTVDGVLDAYADALTALRFDERRAAGESG